MNNSGDAAEQVVRITIDGIEVAAKITGAAAKNIAAMLYTVYKNRDTSKVSSKGREKLNSMLKSGRPLEVFTVSREHFRTFAQQAKSYGVSYCAMKNKGDKDGVTDVLVFRDEAPRINRIAERFRFAEVKPDVKTNTEIAEEKAEKQSPYSKAESRSSDNSEENSRKDNDIILNKLLGNSAEKGEKKENPDPARAEENRRSGRISEKQSRSMKNISKPSVKKELENIREQRSGGAGSIRVKEKNIKER
jgi:hypothetical protein